MTDTLSGVATKVATPSNGAGLAVSRPLYGQVRDLLATRISAGEWTPGAMLPNEAALASSFGVSIGTIRRAVEGLEELGLVIRRQGRGTYVSGLGTSAAADRLCRLRSPTGAQLKMTYQVISRDRRAATALEVTRLRLEKTSEVMQVRTLVYCRHVRIGVETSVLRGDLAALLPREPDSTLTLYALLGAAGVLVTTADENVTAGAADADTSKLLHVSPDAPVLHVRRLASGIDQRPIELRLGTYLASQTAYSTRIV